MDCHVIGTLGKTHKIHVLCKTNEPCQFTRKTRAVAKKQLFFVRVMLAGWVVRVTRDALSTL